MFSKHRLDVSQYLENSAPDKPLTAPGVPDGVIIRDIVDRAADLGPLKKQTLEDPFLLAKTEKYRNGKTILELIAEVGISRRQLMEWPDATIENFIATARRNNVEQGISEPRRYVGFEFAPRNANQVGDTINVSKTK